MSSLIESFGMAVRNARESRTWSQELLAEKADLDRTYISGIERGVRNPTLTTQDRLAAALGVRLSDLLREAEKLAD